MESYERLIKKNCARELIFNTKYIFGPADSETKTYNRQMNMLSLTTIVRVSNQLIIHFDYKSID